jgi:hypothetical protein
MTFPRHLIVFAVSLLCVAAAFGAELSFGDGQANTVAGKLIIKKDLKQPDRVLLGDELVLRGDFRHSAWFVSSAYPRTGAARLVLLGFDSGDNSCRYLYRVLELRSKGQWTISSDFGDCEEFKDLNLPSNIREHSVKSRIVDGEWQLGFPSAHEDGSTTWYRYSNGKIFRGDLEVKGPDEP